MKQAQAAGSLKLEREKLIYLRNKMITQSAVGPKEELPIIHVVVDQADLSVVDL